MNDIYKTIQ